MTIEEEIAEIAELLRQLRAADPGFRVFGSDTHRYVPGPVLSEPALARFEAEHGISLPRDYRLFLQVVGDGGPGPDYGLRSLAAAAQHRRVGGRFPFVRPAAPGPDDEAAGWGWDRDGDPFVGREAFTDWLDAYEPGALELCDHGCAIYTWLAVSGPARGTLWSGAETLHPVAEPFPQWYRAWAEQSLRRARNLPVVDRLRLGMTAAEVAEAAGGAWKERPALDRPFYYLEARDIPYQLELDEERRVVRINPWHAL